MLKEILPGRERISFRLNKKVTVLKETVLGSSVTLMTSRHKKKQYTTIVQLITA